MCKIRTKNRKKIEESSNCKGGQRCLEIRIRSLECLSCSAYMPVWGWETGWMCVKQDHLKLCNCTSGQTGK